LAVTALVAFSGVADASVVVNGTEVASGDYTTGSTGFYNLTNSGVNTIDGGSHWTHNDDGGNGLWKMANRAPTTMTISGGGWLELIGDTSDGGYVFQVGNQGGGVGHMTVTGTGSKVTTLELVQVGRNESNCTLTIEDGGMVMAEMVVLSRDSGTNNLLRMGRGGILAIEGTGKTTTGQFWTTNGTGEMQYNPSGDGTTWLNITGATGGGVDYTLADGTDDLAGYSVLTMAEPATDVPGDADSSGFVDDDDLAILLSNWEQDPGTITTWELGDFTEDTDVDDDDLAVLLGNWTGAPPAGAAVPEPATLALLGLGGRAMLRRRRS